MLQPRNAHSFAIMSNSQLVGYFNKKNKIKKQKKQKPSGCKNFNQSEIHQTSSLNKQKIKCAYFPNNDSY